MRWIGLSLWMVACGTSAPLAPEARATEATAPPRSTPHEVDEPSCERDTDCIDDGLGTCCIAGACTDACARAAPSDAELDAMDRSELELLCEGGSTAACDRLGH